MIGRLVKTTRQVEGEKKSERKRVVRFVGEEKCWKSEP